MNILKRSLSFLLCLILFVSLSVNCIPVAAVVEAAVSHDGLTVTVENLDDAKDFFIAKGVYFSYADVKANRVVHVSSAKIGDSAEYSYILPAPGDYTVLVRYDDSAREYTYKHITISVIKPEYLGNGLQLTVSNIEGIKVIRCAYGDYDSPAMIKRAAGARAFTSRDVLKDKTEYTIQFREPGLASVAVVYNNGYQEIYKYQVTKKTPGFEQNGTSVSFDNLEGLKVLRYAKGDYSTSGEIKRAEGSVALNTNALIDNKITINLTSSGRYTFCVQYDDESYNYYTVDVEVPVVPEPEPEPEPEPLEGAATNLTVSQAFSDNMIVQRDEPFSVWGTADPLSGKVGVAFGDVMTSAEVDSQGFWKATFPNTFSYNKVGQSLYVAGATQNFEFKNVLVGDVYYIMGQSNVFYSMAELICDLSVTGTLNTLTYDFDDTRNMRFYRISSTDYSYLGGAVAQGTTTLYTDVYNYGRWMMPSDIEAKTIPHITPLPTTQNYDRVAISTDSFSALGYLFAYNMTNKSDVPVGVIEIDASGYPLITFAPNELADKWGHDRYDAATGTYYYYLSSSMNDPGMKTRFAYNQQIYPLKNFSTAGIIWYQGESDHANLREIYGIEYQNSFSHQFTELMTYFRNNFGNSDFPVYMIEFPACYDDSGTPAYLDTGGVRAELGTIPQSLTNSYVISSSDLWADRGWSNNIHPYVKHFNAIRLSDAVLAQKFGTKPMDNTLGPELAGAEYTSNTTATLTFDYVGSGLTTADGTGMVTGIELFIQNGSSLSWIPCDGQIIQGTNTISVSSGSYKLWGVRYNRNTEAFFPNTINLCNSYGMPAVAFVDYCKQANIDPSPDPTPVTGAATNIAVSKAFSDNMILQRDEPLSVWGTADPSSGNVYVAFAGQTAYAAVDSLGFWKATFNTTFSYTTTGQPLYVAGANQNITFNNVLIGDVYFMIGQSNVFYSMAEQIFDLSMKNMGTALNVDYNDSRNMRFYRISSTDYVGMTGYAAQGTATEYVDVYNGGSWMMPSDIMNQILMFSSYTPSGVMYDRNVISMEVFSALGYQFAYNMTNLSDVPVGVIEIDAAGAPLISFAPNALASAWGHESYDATTSTYYYNLNGVITNSQLKSRYVYNQQIYPLKNFSTAGIIWYQGESDAFNLRENFGNLYTNSYAFQFTQLMTYFRSNFGNSDFPVYIMELPACYDDSGTAAYMDIGGVRAEIGSIPRMLSDCHIVSSSDLWADTMWENNIHPYIKHLNAIRLASVVAMDKFGIYSADAVKGPVLADVVYSDKIAYLSFNNVGSGLTTADGTGYIKGLEILVLYNGAATWLPYEGNFITSGNQIKIDGGQFTVYGIRYNRSAEGIFPLTANLCNSNGMPAISFIDLK